MKKIPFTKKQIEEIINDFPTPFHLYDEAGIRKTARELKKAFADLPFRNYYAVKALPNPAIMKILFEEGMGMDASSLAELMLCERVGIKGESIMFSSNDAPSEEYKKAKDLGAYINLDDISYIEYLEKNVGLPDLVCLRYNPGPSLDESSESFIMGKPEDAKFGMTKKQIFQGLVLLKKKGVRRFGLHTMIASNELNVRYLIETASMMFNLVNDAYKKTGVSFEFANLGGGIGIPYRPTDKPIDFTILAKGIRSEYEKVLKKGIPPFKIFMESGRAITGPHGYLISKVLHIKNTYKTYVGLDASMANLMRPGMYSAYHQITVLGKEKASGKNKYDVVGSLCENNDKFAIDRMLPKVSIDDIVVIHDTGAHGHAMGFNYNGRLRSAEVLLQPSGRAKLIRRAETTDDYFATLSI